MQSEDCLYLNVIRPAGVDNTTSLPVAVWIHGGTLEMGGAADPRYNFSFIVDRSVQIGRHIIGISLNYRLSAFGFLHGMEAVQTSGPVTSGSPCTGYRRTLLRLGDLRTK